jgi:RecA/RadA recombinase
MAEMASGQITIEISGGRRSGKTATALRLLAEDSRRWLAIRERIVVSDAQLHGRDVSAVIYDLE